jgi:hypothetical protein
MSSNTGTDMYNAMADMWNDLWTNISSNGITIPLLVQSDGGLIKEGGSLTIGGSAGAISFTELGRRDYSAIYVPDGAGDGAGTGNVSSGVSNENNTD